MKTWDGSYDVGLFKGPQQAESSSTCAGSMHRSNVSIIPVSQSQQFKSQRDDCLRNVLIRHIYNTKEELYNNQDCKGGMWHAKGEAF